MRGDDALRDETLIRVVEGAGEDALGAIPRALRERFPELAAGARDRGPDGLKQDLLLSLWAGDHGLADDTPAPLAECARELRRAHPDVLAAWAQEIDARLGDAFWEKEVTRRDLADDVPCLIAAACRETLFPACRRVFLARGLSLALTAGAALDVPARVPEDAGARRAHRATQLASRFLACTERLARPIAAAAPPHWQHALQEDIAPAVHAFHALRNMAGALGIALDVQGAQRRLAGALARHEEGFQACMARGEPAGVLRIDTLERRLLARHTETFRPARVLRLLADGLRYDLWLCLKEEFLPQLGATFRTVEETALWAYLPATTATQLAKLTTSHPRQIFGPQIMNREAYLAAEPGDAILKVDYLDELCHGLKGGLDDFYREAVSGAAIKLQGILEALPARTLILLFGDHGFTENPAFDPAQKFEEPRYVHGGASLFEIIVPAVVLFKV